MPPRGDAVVATRRQLLTLELAFFQALHAGILELVGDTVMPR